jgi:hypothetical protein
MGMLSGWIDLPDPSPRGDGTGVMSIMMAVGSHHGVPQVIFYDIRNHDMVMSIALDMSRGRCPFPSRVGIGHSCVRVMECLVDCLKCLPGYRRRDVHNPGSPMVQWVHTGFLIPSYDSWGYPWDVHPDEWMSIRMRDSSVIRWVYPLKERRRVGPVRHYSSLHVCCCPLSFR